MASQKRVFNLLKPIEKPKDFWDSLYMWIVIRARIIILILLIFFVLLFFVRVVVDNQGKNKRNFFYSDEVFNLYKTFESQVSSEFRKIQIKSQEYSKLWNNSSNIYPFFNEVYTLVSQSAQNLSIELQKNTLVVRGQDNITNINALESGLKRSPRFVKVLVEIASDQRQTQNEIADFTIIATIAEELYKRKQL